MAFDREKWRTKPKDDRDFHLDKRVWWYHDGSDSYFIGTYREQEASCWGIECDFICDALDHETDEDPSRAIAYQKAEWQMRYKILQEQQGKKA
jgi:hypothetical protein